MAMLVVHDHASRYRSVPGSKNRNIAGEAYVKAAEDLENEIRVAGCTAMWAKSHATIEDVRTTVQKVKVQYDNASKDHTGARVWLEKLSSRIMHYGKVFDTLAQHHPEYVALAWGAMKLVLMGVIERATLLEELATAFVSIGDVLPRADLSAELYQTEDMKEALSRLYAYIIRFLHLCVHWYSRSSLGRFFSGLKNPFKLEYQDLVEHIKACSTAIEDLANAGARVEIRDISTIQAIHHSQFMDLYSKLLQKHNWMEDSLKQLLQVTTSSKAITERVGIDVSDIKRTTCLIEFHHLVQFLAPNVPPKTALSKAQSFARRDPTMGLLSQKDVKVNKTLHAWALAGRSSLLVVRMGLRAQKQARELAADVIQGLETNSQHVFWNLSLPRSSDTGTPMANVFKSLAHQALRHSTNLFAQFPKQLNLEKIQSSHTDGEWADLICLLFSKIPDAFIVIETEDLHKVHRHDSEWANRLLRLLQRVVSRATSAGNRLKILLVVYGNVLKAPTATSKDGELVVTSIQPPAPMPPRMRHMARRMGLNTKGWKLQKPKI
ncbi:hypothetical protein CC86DRAFT_312074 [Ophiobolus disseminans]|uniref:DUF7708 domain-containing protein n=1 Tax=Ophiobolus disseminans TaxID=1469910 RepID=A0A6A7AL68_9PLEO|nr:hypothetical protein CC86DRAFT_312074 [Ophiobolus disseminans]